ncbi:bifunctional metallophosphatase/5'-nucleotidase [Mongoliitalea daihaiensis]|uniref:bifunctional metallophosphatase/5'-nucleotidase n=1 Tax=Mongoliitalea daihaiensis TaxID=2782006 RepID=UPI001F381BF4|nr:metallophosphatase [Mongoliitalea daihaiensis]UJP64984.1 metallophosphatase [Mongoliitalea daihaiensis]
MNRRIFIKNTVLTGIGAGLMVENLWATPKVKKITILHTNDIHSRIESFPNDGSRNANQGGMNKLATVIESIRSSEEQVLLFDAGDVFQGTPYFNLYGGEIEFRLMSKMGYDAGTLGNHEFDNGLEGIEKQLVHAKFPHLIANYDFSNTLLKNAFEPYRIFQKGGVKIGAFGLGIQLEGLVGKKNYGATKYLDPVAVSKEMVQELRKKKCDIIVCLSHLGYSYRSNKIDDLKLAQEVEGIHLIIGGHTHSFLDRPTEVAGPNGSQTLVNQVGTGALRLGKIDFTFEGSSPLAHHNSKVIHI